MSEPCSAAAIRVGIVDDHPIVRKALKVYLGQEEGIVVGGEASSGSGAIDLVRTHPIDVLLLDLDMPGRSGLDVLPMVKASSIVERLGVLMFSGYPEQIYAVPLIRQGASGYLNKACDPAKIVEAIRVVAQGRRFITPEVAELLLAAVFPPERAGADEALSVRDMQMLMKLARGRNAREVASELSLSPKTVSHLRTRLMQKLHARTTGDLTYYALQHRLLA